MTTARKRCATHQPALRIFLSPPSAPAKSPPAFLSLPFPFISFSFLPAQSPICLETSLSRAFRNSYPFCSPPAPALSHDYCNYSDKEQQRVKRKRPAANFSATQRPAGARKKREPLAPRQSPSESSGPRYTSSGRALPPLPSPPSRLRSTHFLVRETVLCLHRDLPRVVATWRFVAKNSKSPSLSAFRSRQDASTNIWFGYACSTCSTT